MSIFDKTPMPIEGMFMTPEETAERFSTPPEKPKRVIQVRYSVEVSEQEFSRLAMEAKSQGCGFDDAGPILTVKRFLRTKEFREPSLTTSRSTCVTPSTNKGNK